MATSSTFPTDNQYIKYRIVVTENSTSIANNTSSVTVKVQAWRTNTGYETYGTGTCYCTINGSSYSQSISSSQKIKYNSYTTLFSQTVTIPHDADGTKSIYVQAKISHARFTSSYHGFTVALTNIPRQATITAVTNFNDEGNPTITYSNSAGETVTSLDACISLTGSNPDVPYRAISKTGTTYTFELTEAERNTLRNATPNSNTLTVYFYVRTVIAGQTYYSNKPATMTIVNANPTINRNDYADSNGNTVAITGNSHLIIQNKSTVQFALQGINAYKGATLSSYAITVNSVTNTQSLSGSSVGSSLMNFGVINSSSNVQAQIVVTDSRGNKTTYTRSITMLAWSAPTGIITCGRRNNFYSETDLYVNADYASLDNKNSITITYYYKETSASSWTTGGTMSDESTVTLSLDNTKSWDIKVSIQDVFATTTYLLSVDKGIPIIFFDRQMRSVGINCFPAEENSIESDGLILDDIVYVGQQTLLDSYSKADMGYVAVLGSYGFDLISGIFNGITIPSSYVRAYRITAQVSTTNDNMAKVKINNIESSQGNTWSALQTMRKIVSTPIFKESDITLEPTLNYTAKDGCNLYCGNTKSSGTAYFYNVTVHGYLVKANSQVIAQIDAGDDPEEIEPAT
jgi:hypothetical protein